MANSVLDSLLSDEINAYACALSTDASLKQFLEHRPEVRAVSQAMRSGAITDDLVRSFIATLLKDQRKGVLFCHDRVLAAVAVALAGVYSTFANQYLRDLSSLKIAEMPMGPRVARLLLEQRPSIATVNVQTAAGKAERIESRVVSHQVVAGKFARAASPTVEKTLILTGM